jgi:dipeptidyl aminopeptidase/acylaminoacyl peptidase
MIEASPFVRRLLPALLFLLGAQVGFGGTADAMQPAQHALTIDDVLNLTRIEGVALSPNGETAAIVVQRPAQAGEVFGRTAYEVDPGRSDIWLITLNTGATRNLTQGHELAAGFWCPSWSPDGVTLAMLSTKPEEGEPRGGNNVRLYLWDGSSGRPRRVSDVAVSTQTRYGSPMRPLDLRGGATGAITQRCSDEDNAPFLWLDQKRILAVTLPDGQVSGLIDEYARPAEQASRTFHALRKGGVPTVTAMASGEARQALAERSESVQLRLLDTTTREATLIGDIPLYPFRGELTISVSPDGRRAAVMTPVGGIQPAKGLSAPTIDETWLVEKRLGFLDLGPRSSIRWAATTGEARFPLELFGWSPDSSKVAFRARQSFQQKLTPLFVASSASVTVRKISAPGSSVGGAIADSAYPREREVVWLDRERLLVRLAAEQQSAAAADAAGPARQDWWVLGTKSRARNITAAMPESPSVLRPITAGRFLALAGDNLLMMRIADNQASFSSRSTLAPGSSPAWPREVGSTTDHFVIEQPGAGGSERLYRIFAADTPGEVGDILLSERCRLVAMDASRGTALCLEAGPDGTYLKMASSSGRAPRIVFESNRHLGSVAWGETRIIDYKSRSGQALKGAVILPPDFSPHRRYPVLTWVYPGYQVRGPGSYFLDPYLPGIYNLQLYAARGYVVLIPSLPIAAASDPDHVPDFSEPTLAGVDALVGLGIGDPDRIAVMGQSFGGFGVYALVGQTSRFKAAIALSGDTDFIRFYGSISPLARGYPGIEHELSLNWVLSEIGQVNLQSTPYANYERYWRRSPIAYLDQVTTPLLLIHGEYDKRAPMSEAEAFFVGLYRQGKTARLLRYWGESHSLAQSPANIRNIYEETLAWLNRYLAEVPKLPR